MTIRIQVEEMIGGSIEGSKLVDKKSYRVMICEDSTCKVVEARITLGKLETLSDPQRYIREFFKDWPLPQAAVIDIP